MAEQKNLYAHQDSNIRKTWLLMSLFLILVIGLGWVFSYILQSQLILYIAVGISILMNAVAYWKSDKIALSRTGAEPADEDKHPKLFSTAETLAITAGIPAPDLYVIPEEQINAFATGRNPKNASIAVTTGALEKLDEVELEGVLAHEIAHITNRDILISSITVVLAGVIALMADFFLRISFFSGEDRGRIGLVLGIIVAILAPLAATLIRLAVSRKREFVADSSGALLTRYPEGLANALKKISKDQSEMDKASHATAHLFFSSPFSQKEEKTSWFKRIFMTHPPIEERVGALKSSM